VIIYLVRSGFPISFFMYLFRQLCISLFMYGYIYLCIDLFIYVFMSLCMYCLCVRVDVLRSLVMHVFVMY